MHGITKLSVDSKGRVAIPKVHRERLLADGVRQLVVTVDPAGSLLIYPAPEWEKIEAKLMNAPNVDRRTRNLQRLYIGYATDTEFDSSGRILLSSELREYAAIERRVVLLGQVNKFELWSEARFAKEVPVWTGRDSENGEAPDALRDMSV